VYLARSDTLTAQEADMWQPGKPSSNEDEYFLRRDAEWLKEQRAKLDAERQAKQRG
jgi:hypothetical protein